MNYIGRITRSHNICIFTSSFKFSRTSARSILQISYSIKLLKNSEQFLFVFSTVESGKK